MTPISEPQRIELIVKIVERLIAALEADIAALEAGRPRHLKMTEPGIQKLSAAFGSEIRNLNPAGAGKVPAELRKKFRTVTARFRELLRLHMRYVTRVRNASEGIIKAVAEDVEKRRNALRPYAPPRSGYRPAPGAIVYNAVI
jgi:hypothetical protein